MESVGSGMDFTGQRMRSRYRALIRQLVPFIERGDWTGVIDHIEQEWRVWDILFVWNWLRQIEHSKLEKGKPLEAEETKLEDLLLLRLMGYFISMGWWGAVAGDERDKYDPFLATPGQLEEAITRKGETGNAPGKNEMMERILKGIEKLDVGMAKQRAQGDRLEAQIEANGATLAGIDATTRATDGKVDALVGRGADNAVKPPHMAQLITAALKKVGNHKGVTGRTVENWVAYLKTGGEKGTRPPAGFTLNTLRTLEAAADFAAKYADAEARRLRVDIAFNEHDSRLEEEARRRHADEQEARFKRLDG